MTRGYSPSTSFPKKRGTESPTYYYCLHTPTRFHHPADTQSLTTPATSFYELKQSYFKFKSGGTPPKSFLYLAALLRQTLSLLTSQIGAFRAWISKQHTLAPHTIHLLMPQESVPQNNVLNQRTEDPKYVQPEDRQVPRNCLSSANLK